MLAVRGLRLRPSTVFQFKSSSVYQFWSHVNSVSHPHGDFAGRSLGHFCFISADANGGCDIGITGHSLSGMRGAFGELWPNGYSVLLQPVSTQRVQRDSSHLTNRHGRKIAGHRLAQVRNASAASSARNDAGSRASERCRVAEGDLTGNRRPKA